MNSQLLAADSDQLLVVDLRGPHRPQRPYGALTAVCGLPVLVRTLLLLARHGWRKVVVLVHPGDRCAVEPVVTRAGCTQVTLTWIEDAGETLSPVAQAAEGRDLDLLYWPGDITCGLALPTRVNGAGHDPVIMAAGRGAATDVVLRLRWPACGSLSEPTVDQLVERLTSGGSATAVEAVPELRPVRSAADVREAERRLLASLRKDTDGMCARYFRYVSLAITRRIAGLPIAPTHVTLVAGFVGIGSGVLAARGGYWWLLGGAVGFLVSNVFDGIDGELARARLASSVTGEWLDTVADDLTNLSFCVGSAIGSYRTWHEPTYLVLAALIAAGLFASACVLYRNLITVAHSGDLNAVQWPWEHGKTAPELRGLRRLRLLVRRDVFAAMAVLGATAGQARVSVWLAAVGAQMPWLAWLGYTLRGRRVSKQRWA